MKKINIIVTSAILMTTLFVGASEAGYIEPGSESDPLVSKSYVENKIDEVKNSSASESFKVLQLKKGETIIGEKNTEMIVRSGRTEAIAGDKGGVSDITAGLDLQTGNDVLLNHHLLIPRSDGRGIKVKNDEVFIMIKCKLL